MSQRRHDPTAPMCCFRCKETKVAEQFYLVKGKRKGPCKACKLVQSREWTKKNPSKRRAIWRKSQDSNRDRTNERNRQYYERHSEKRRAVLREYAAKNPGKIEARKALYLALLRKEIHRKPCQSCGAAKRIQAHHHDYSKPFDVTWLCSTCHGKEHRRAA